MRYEVHDELGALRRFWRREEALAWMLPGMTLKVLPRVRKPRLDLSAFEEALL